MQAIRTRYLPCTNTHGSRIQAKCEAKTITVPYDHALDSWGNHKAACLALVRTLGWGDSKRLNTMHGGEFARDTYWVFAAEFAGIDIAKGE